MSDDWQPSDHSQQSGALQQRIARGVTWTVIDTWGSQGLGLLVIAILARLLQQIDFGLVILAAVFIGFTQLLVDQGLGDALVQRRTLTRRQIDTAFWAALLTGCLLTLVGVLFARPIAGLLGNALLEPILMVLSLTFILSALTSIQMALLRRELAFRSLAIRKLAAVGGGGIVGVALAFAGFGVWALVGQQLASAAISVLTLWTVSPWRPGRSFSRADFRELFGFGINVVAGDALNFISRNADNLLIGVFLGPLLTGFYGIAYRLLDTSQVLLLAFSKRVAFPTFARLQHDADRARRAYLRMSRVSGVITLPGYIGLAVVAHEAVEVIFGPNWAASANTAAILFLIGPVLTLQVFSGGVWNAAGHPETTFRFRLLSSVVNVIGFVIAVTVFGTIEAVALAFVVRGYLLLPLNLYWMQTKAGVPMRDHLWELRGIAAATAVMAAAVIVAKIGLGPALQAGPLLAAEVMAGVVSYTVALWLIDRAVFKEALGFVLSALPGGGRLARRLHLSLPGSEGRGGRRGQPDAAAEPSVDPLADPEKGLAGLD